MLRFPSPVRQRLLGLLVGVTALLSTGSLLAQVPMTGPLDPLALARLKDFEARRATSNNLLVDSNDDSKRPVPGESVVLADLEGPGIVTHIWTTVAANEYGWPRLLRFRVYYDGSNTPSIDVPLGDFFAVGHGYERNVDSLMVRNSSNGRSRNSYWPMPFRKSCRITVTNEGSRRVSMFYYQVDWQKHDSLPPNVGYLHAFYKQELPAINGRHYEVLSVKGKGHLVGALINVVQTEPGWFGEGDDLFYVDGSSTPTLEGTGTEDYFNDAWSLRVSNGLFTGVPIADGRAVGSRLSGYRWHLADPVPFNDSLDFRVEHKGWIRDEEGLADGFAERFDLWSSVALWYQESVNADLPEPPYGAARLPHGNATQIEVEEIAGQVTVENGEAIVQREVFWSKDLLTLRGRGVGTTVSIPFEVLADGYYEIVAQVAHGPAYGHYEVTLDGKPIAPRSDNDGTVRSVRIDAYGSEMYVAADHLIGWADLTRGRHILTFTCIGKADASSGFNIGIDNFIVARIADAARIERRAGAKGRWKVAPLSAEQRDGQRVAGTEPSYRGTPLADFVARLQERDRGSRAAAARAIGQFGAAAAPAVDQLTRLLQDTDSEVRQASAESLALLGPLAAEAVPALAPLLQDRDPRTRVIAALALREIGVAARPALPQMIAALADEDLVVRMTVALAIGRLGNEAVTAVDALMTAGNERPDDWISVPLRDMRRAVCWALGEIGPGARHALPLMREWTRFYRVRWVSEAAIAKIEGRPAPATWLDAASAPTR